jgi:hypothetical protein
MNSCFTGGGGAETAKLEEDHHEDVARSTYRATSGVLVEQSCIGSELLAMCIQRDVLVSAGANLRLEELFGGRLVALFGAVGVWIHVISEASHRRYGQAADQERRTASRSGSGE